MNRRLSNLARNFGGLAAAAIVGVSAAGTAHAADGAQTGQTAAAKESGQPDGPSDEEIVVTAQRIEERLLDVPISITAISGRDLDRFTDRSISETLNRVPGVVSIPGSGGERAGGFTGVVVRGVAPVPGLGAGTTAYYLDSIPFGFVRRSDTPDPNAYDLERVEVLRGPQGTLYGLSALNGVVRVLTKDANLNEFEFKARASGSLTERGSGNYRGDAVVNIPIVEGKVAVRLVAGYQDWAGWIDKSFKKDANDRQIGNYRIKVNAEPTDRLSIGLLAWLSRTDIGAPSNSHDGRTSLSQVEEPSSIDYDAYGLKIGYDLSGAQLTGMTSYIDYTNHSSFDFSPFGPGNLLSKFDSQVFSQEIILGSNNDSAWQWSVGGLYRRAEDYTYQLRTLVNGAFAPGYLAPNEGSVVSKSIAVFGELRRSFNDGRLEVIGGLRYFKDNVEDSEVSRFNWINGTIDPATGQPGTLISVKNKFDHVSPRLVLNWHPSPDTTLYASYGQGFRSGLNQAAAVTAAAPNFAPADPDKLRNYELGAKGSVWDGRLNFDAAVFFTDWSGVQQQITVQIAPGILSSAVVNAGSASGIGAEAGVSAELVSGLTLGLNFSWNNLEVDKTILAANGAVVFPKGARLLGSAETTGSAMLDYVFPLSSTVKGRFSTSANYTSSFINDLAPNGQAFKRESVVLVRTSFGIQSSRGWDISLYIDNVTNEKGLVTDRFSPRWNSYLRPRTTGLQLQYRY